jgi:heme A synthase
MFGFAVKGATWGLLGGATAGLALAPPTRSRLAITLIAMLAAAWLGWRVVNEPKIIYFSNLLDRPRPEVWAGLLLAGLVVALMHGTLVRRFALCGMIGGGAGYARGARVQVLGRAHAATTFTDWWKVMELTFGALLGASYAWAAWSVEPIPEAPAESSSSRIIPSFAGAALAIAIAIFFVPVLDRLHIRFSYTVAGALLLFLATRSSVIARHIGITVTCCAFL